MPPSFQSVIEPPSPVMRLDGVEPIASDITRLLRGADTRDTIQEWLEQRASLLRKANSLSSSTTSLPNEILATIFIGACPPINFNTRPWPLKEDGDNYDDGLNSETWPLPPKVTDNITYRYFPLTLSSVCSHWRQVALSTPTLWNSLVQGVTCTKIQTQSDLLSHYLSNSSCGLFSLELDFRRYTYEISKLASSDRRLSQSETSLEPFKRLLVENAGRIRLLRFVDPSLDWLSILSDAFLKVEDIAVGWTDGSFDEGITFPSSPYLQKVTISRYYRQSMASIPSFPYHISVLHLYKIPISTAVELLVNCRQLKEFFNLVPLPDYLDLRSPIETTLIHQDMQSFGWTWYGNSHHNASVLQHLRMPQLRHLMWSGDDEDDDHTFNALWALRHKPKSLRLLNFFQMSGSIKHRYRFRYRCLFDNVSQAKELGFVECSSEFIHDILSILSHPNPFAQTLMKEDVPLPNLELIRVHGLKFERGDPNPEAEQDNKHILIGRLCDMGYRRSEMLNSSTLRVELLNCDVSYKPEAQYGPRSLTQNGFSLQVLQNSKEIECLREGYLVRYKA